MKISLLDVEYCKGKVERERERGKKKKTNALNYDR